MLNPSITFNISHTYNKSPPRDSLVKNERNSLFYVLLLKIVAFQNLTNALFVGLSMLALGCRRGYGKRLEGDTEVLSIKHS